ncbi:MAG TPA: prolipoprotein diacylglyceryl transferase [Mariprofundaceae bacterium]|nr:prolipoprotein diacylglyceryl transferase [Mariprofundaceae bacterium]
MLHWPEIDPVAIHLGPLAIHWYGLMYVAGFAATWYLVRKQLRENGLWETRVSPQAYEGLFTWLILGVVLGGRIAYILFYNPDYYLEHPLEVFYVWQGGMSFHGGLVGPILAGWWYCRKHGLPFLELADRFFVVAPIGLAFGRLGNFINGELWGRVTDVPWGMVFPQAGPEPRHPSQLYELGLEGIALFCLLWFTRRLPWPAGSRVALFLTGYAVARIFCENFRQPDKQLGFLFDHVTMGMLLSSAMLAAGIVWGILLARRSKSADDR